MLIASDLALRLGAEPAKMVSAIKYILAKHDFKAGRYSVGYQSCDDSTPQSPNGDLAKCSSNSKAYAADATVVALVGTWFSTCSKTELPILDSSPSGALVLVSPTNTETGLTHAGGGTAPREPGRYYPTGKRNFARVIAPDDFQGIAAAVLAKQLHLQHVFVLEDAEPYGLDVSAAFKAAAQKLRIEVAGSAAWSVSQSRFGNVASTVARADPDAVLLGGYACPGCGSLVKQLRAALPHAAIIAPDGFLPVPAIVKAVGHAADGMYITEPGLPPAKFGPLGQTLERKFGTTRVEAGGAPVAAQVAEILLQAIASSDGSRSSVTAHVLEQHVPAGILGPFAFDRNGDMDPAPVTVHRVVHGRDVIDRVVRVSSRLLR